MATCSVFCTGGWQQPGPLGPRQMLFWGECFSLGFRLERSRLLTQASLYVISQSYWGRKVALTDSVSMEFSICSLCITQKARRDPMFSEDRKKFLSGVPQYQRQGILWSLQCVGCWVSPIYCQLLYFGSPGHIDQQVKRNWVTRHSR